MDILVKRALILAYNKQFNAAVNLLKLAGYAKHEINKLVTYYLSRVIGIKTNLEERKLIQQGLLSNWEEK